MNAIGKVAMTWGRSKRQETTRGQQTELLEVPTEQSKDRASLGVDLDTEETVWLRRAKEGNLEAFNWLMNRYRERAVRLAAHVLRRPAEAEDLVQEAFLRAFSQIQGFRGEAQFYTWLYRIVVRLCLNRMRSPEWGNRECEMDDLLLANVTVAETSDTRLFMETLLDNLSPPLRAALILREVEGLDYTEIAETLQIPVGTVRSRLSAARLQFRTLWERAMEDVKNV